MSKPLISFVVFSYNQEEYICDAIESAFAQDYESLEIILSDDCSPDGTYKVMKDFAESYSGAHQVRLLDPLKKNIGLIPHLNRVFAEAKGEWIVLCAGDDAATPQRCSEIMQQARESKVTKGIFSGYVDCNETMEPGQEVLPLQTSPMSAWGVCRNGGYVFPGATFAMHRECVDLFGPLDEQLRAEDWVLPLRAAVIGQLAFLPKALVSKRNLPESLTKVNKSLNVSFFAKVLNPSVRRVNQLTLKTARKNALISIPSQWIMSLMLWFHSNVQFCHVAAQRASVGAILVGLLSSLVLLRKQDASELVGKLWRKGFARNASE